MIARLACALGLHAWSDHTEPFERDWCKRCGRWVA